jgi:VRR-NUC domain-containing protein
MSEHSEQALVIEWAQRHEGLYPELRWLYSSLNGIFIPAPKQIVYKIINHMKQEGMKKGIADLCLPVARRGYHGLYIELKRDENSEIKPEQIEFMAFVAEQGYCDKICRGYDETIEVLEWYLKVTND